MNNNITNEMITEMKKYVNQRINAEILDDCANINFESLLPQDYINSIVDEVYNNNHNDLYKYDEAEDLDTTIAGL